MNSDKLCVAIGKVMPRFECSPAPQEGVRVRTPLMYPDGDIVDVFVLERDDGYMVTDFGDALGWLHMQSESMQQSQEQRLMIEDLCRTLGIELHSGQLVLRSDSDDTLEKTVLRVAQAVASVSASTSDNPPRTPTQSPMTVLTEAVVEDAALAWLENLGWTIAHGPDIATEERTDYGQVILEQRLRNALARLNPSLPADALDDAFRKLTRPVGPTLEARNSTFHRMLVDGVTVEYRADDGSIRGAQAQVVNFDDVAANDWLAVNQFTVTENRHNRRPDIVLFVNGLPLVLIELKNPADEDATIRTAWQQIQTYKAELPSLFAMNEALVVSDGVAARIGTLTSGWEWFKPWRTVAGEALAPASLPELQVLIEGVFEQRRFLDLVRDFIAFEDSGGGVLAKKMAGYHQFHAVRVAVGETLRAAELQQADERAADVQGRYEAGSKPGGELGDRRIGVVWHTQGSGKSLTMAFYAGAVIHEPAMGNPTIVVLTDRNDLDDQLFSTFSRCRDLLRQSPVQADSRADLRNKLSVESGGVVFTTIQKFFPEEKGDAHPVLSPRPNIVVIADEAHRSQYDFIDGFARHLRDALPQASFVGFTGTPIERQDANTRAVFGDYISIYDIQRSVEDGATVPIYYESRLAKLALNERERPLIDPKFEEVTEGEEVECKEKIKTKWAQLEAIVGTKERLKLIAQGHRPAL